MKLLKLRSQPFSVHIIFDISSERDEYEYSLCKTMQEIFDGNRMGDERMILNPMNGQSRVETRRVLGELDGVMNTSK